ncbi:MAG: chromosomal replication initiator protein DnaA [Sedimentisphaerales bacterium]|nr:chromosomal replication initiator protein DnaA [Sedimentisphaerales bacterium]
MSATCTDIVEKINCCIAQKVGQQRHKIWFKNSTRLLLEEDYVKVGVPNLFIGGWIENHFTDQIRDAVQEVTNRPVKVIFTIDPDLFGGQRRRQLDSQAEFVSKSTSPVRRKKPQDKPRHHTALRHKLENYVVGNSNQLAYSAAKTVVAEPRTHFNPLFIHGGCGLGKTHLLQGICNAVRDIRPQTRFLCVSGEEFTNQFVLSLKMGKLDNFRQRFRQTDLLLIDDVHFLASKKATQEEFLHTFNAIDTANKQVVLASDAHPKMIGELSDSLVNRFISGMVVKIEPPEFETRCSILRQRTRELKKNVPDSAIEYIAENLRANVRELEGALLKVIAYASLSSSPISLAIAKEALEDHIARTDPIVHLSDIEAAVTTFFGITPADVHSSKKTRTISLARSVAMYLARKHTTMSFPEIGRFMGNKNHATVILACRKINGYLGDQDTPVTWETPMGKREMKINPILEKLESSISR